MFINCFWLLSVLNAGLGFVGRNLVCYLVEHELCSKVRVSLFEPLVKATSIIHGKAFQNTNMQTNSLVHPAVVAGGSVKHEQRALF